MSLRYGTGMWSPAGPRTVVAGPVEPCLAGTLTGRVLTGNLGLRLALGQLDCQTHGGSAPVDPRGARMGTSWSKNTGASPPWTPVEPAGLASLHAPVGRR